MSRLEVIHPRSGSCSRYALGIIEIAPSSRECRIFHFGLPECPEFRENLAFPQRLAQDNCAEVVPYHPEIRMNCIFYCDKFIAMAGAQCCRIYSFCDSEQCRRLVI